MSMTIEQIHTERPVTNTFHNIIQTLSIKIDSAARYGLYADDARSARSSAPTHRPMSRACAPRAAGTVSPPRTSGTSSPTTSLRIH
jgi:hypothetical protein